MSDIINKVAQIRDAVFGSDVRENIASGIEAINTEVESTTARQTEVETSLQEVIDMGNNPSAEVQQARKGEANLGTKIDLIDSQLAESVQQIPMPPKNGVSTKNPKLVIVGATNEEINVVQYIGNKYAIYKFNKSNGDDSATSVGGNWDLIRLKKATMASSAYLAKVAYDVASTVGTVETLFAPSSRNILEDRLVYQMTEENSSEFLSSSGDGYGLGIYSIVGASAISSVTYKVKVGSSKKCNILVYGSSASTPSADILVNGEVVKSFDATKMYVNASSYFKVIEFEIPISITGTTVDVTLRNNSVANKKLYFSCVNFMFLKDYDGRDIDFYKVFGTTSYWINATGASDYAIFDHDLQKWCGSFHGGETSLSRKITWYGSDFNPTTQWNEGRFVLKNKSEILPGWIVIPNFEIQQLTNINGKGKMLSKINFDIDGTIDMNFSFYDGTISVESFYTALTCTHVGFDWLLYPRYEALPAPPQKLYLSNNDGIAIQLNPTLNLALVNRHSRFNTKYSSVSKKGGWIQNDAVNFKKYYCGYAQDYLQGVLVNNLTFRKALDFIYE